MADRLTGKASYFVFDGQQIPITKVTRKATRKDADTTDNGDYNSANDVIYPTQLIVSVGTEITVEGRYRRSVNPSLNSAAIYASNPGGVPVSLGLDTNTVAGHGYFDVTDYEETDPVDDVVTYTMSMKSNGQFVPNS